MNQSLEISNQFWQLIDESNTKKDAQWHEYNIDEHIENLTKLVAKLPDEQIVNFEIDLRKAILALDMAQIAELNMILDNEFTLQDDKYIVDGYLSDDGFIYFRCWLILKGKAFFDEIRQDIQNFINGKYSFNIGNIWAEDLLYVADNAYLINHKDEKSYSPIRDKLFPTLKQSPELDYDFGGNSMMGELHKGDELYTLYPKLIKSIAEIK